jgi:hypothetical protein
VAKSLVKYGFNNKGETMDKLAKLEAFQARVHEVLEFGMEVVGDAADLLEIINLLNHQYMFGELPPKLQAHLDSFNEALDKELKLLELLKG